MKFQELLEIIKKYNQGTDYLFTKMELGNGFTGEKFEEADIYQIYLLQLKKEARKLILNGDTEDGGICRLGSQIGEKWYHYEKGDGNQPDKFEIKEISPEERRKEQEKRDRDQARRDREQAERDRETERRRKEKENSPETFDNKKKCAECSQEIDWTKGGISSNVPGEGRLYFHSGCCSKYHNKKNGKGENEPNDSSPRGKKCAGCDNTLNSNYIEGDGKGSWYCSRECADNNTKFNQGNDNLKCAECGDTGEGKDYWGYTIIDGKTYCDACFDKKPKKSETEIEKDRQNALKKVQQNKLNALLNDLKSKLQYSTNPAEREMLNQKIQDTENHLRELENKKNNPNQTGSPKEGYGKIIVTGAVIFSVVILASVLIIRKRRKKVIKKQS